MNIPYGRQTIDQDDIDAVVDALKSDFMTQGPRIPEFEKVVAEYHGCKFAVAFCNGTAALHACYHAAGLKPGEEFITSPITFVASANGGLYVGGIPRFVDINERDFCIDLGRIEESLTPKTRVITPVSFGGYPVDLKRLRTIADRHGLTIIHDAAHAIGARRDGRSVSEHADMTILSFHPVKHVATGEGGMVLTEREDLYRKLILFRTHGLTRDPALMEENEDGWYYEMQDLGFNYRITDMQCALGTSQMKKLDHSLFRRNEIARFYHQELADLEWLKLPDYTFDTSWLDNSAYADLKEKPRDMHAYHLFPVQVREVSERKQVYDYLRESGIFVQVHYIPVHTMPYYRERYGFKRGDFPIAERFYAGEISLPMFPALKAEQLAYVVKMIRKFK